MPSALADPLRCVQVSLHCLHDPTCYFYRLLSICFVGQTSSDTTWQSIRITSWNIIPFQQPDVCSHLLQWVRFQTEYLQKVCQTMSARYKPFLSCYQCFDSFLDALLRMKTDLIINACRHGKFCHTQILPRKRQPYLILRVHITPFPSPRFHASQRDALASSARTRREYIRGYPRRHAG